MRAMSPSSITIRDIYASIVPFVLIMIAALVIFPEIALWLPEHINIK